MASTITEEDRARLRAFRAAAAKVRLRTAVDQAHIVNLHIDEHGSLTTRLLPEEPFIALLAAVRLVYMNDEPAHFYSIHKIVHRSGDPEIQRRAADLRSQYQATIEGGHSAMRIKGQVVKPVLTINVNGHEYSAEQILRTFMYAAEFHQDLQRQEDLERLEATQGVAAAIAHGMILAIAGRILDMDDVVADLLGEPRLPRIGQ